MLKLSKARQIVFEEISKLNFDTEIIPTCEAQGRFSAETIFAKNDYPSFRASIMDGYAVVSKDGLGVFELIESGETGSFSNFENFELKSGQVSYITTGSPVPKGADAVVKVEQTSKNSESKVKIQQSVEKGQQIRPIGSDIKKDTLLINKGDLLKSVEIGLLVSLGIAQVKVQRKVRVGILSTGNELYDENLFNHFQKSNENNFKTKIYDSNRPMLISLINEMNSHSSFEILNMGIVKDDSLQIEKILVYYLSEEKCDIVITTGGQSMGSHDFTKKVLPKLGKLHFERLCIKPGKPTSFASIDSDKEFLRNKFVFGLPGNPVSSLVTFRLVVRPALLQIASQRHDNKDYFEYPKLKVTLVEDITEIDRERIEYIRSIVQFDHASGKFYAKGTGNQISSRLLSCKTSNSLIETSNVNQEGKIYSGTQVDAFLFDKLPNNFLQINNEFSFLKPSFKKVDEIACQCKILDTKNYASKTTLRIGILTISDRAHRNTFYYSEDEESIYKDVSGPKCLHLLQDFIQTNEQNKFGCVEAFKSICPDDIDEIQDKIKRQTDITFENCSGLVITTGGTGFSSKDVTPEATMAILDKETPGISQAMLQIGLKHTPYAMLSRSKAGIRNKSIIVNLPGNPKAIDQILPEILPALFHGLHLINFNQINDNEHKME